MKYVLIGAGSRGMIYAQWAVKHGEEIAALAEPRKDRREDAARLLGVPADMCFADGAELLAKGKIADAAIIATMDRDHYAQVMQALNCGYDILLEKPISPNPKECLEIEAKANALGRKITVCHVLRYTNFFAKLKEILDSKTLGKIVAIKHAENIAHWHMAHSFVRGNWRNSAETSPIIMQKSCHDMDILVWLVDSEAKRISSFGDRTFFREENAPEGSADRCLECPVADSCRFDVRKAYLPFVGEWPAAVVTEDPTREGLLKALETSPYGRCVYRCDNDVCDHQVSIIEFKNGVTATFHLSGLTNKMHRTIKVMCEHGEIVGDDSDNTLVVTHYSANALYQGQQRTLHVESAEGFHGGGDLGLTRDFLSCMEEMRQGSRSSIDRSIESHLMAYAAEISRVTGQVVDMEALKAQLRK